MSSDDEDDLFSYTPLQRSQVSKRETKPVSKPSRLSLSQSQKVKEETAPSQSTPQKRKTESKRTKTTPRKISKKSTPVKSRADHPEPNCSLFELRKWNFLYGSQSSNPGETSGSTRRKSETGDSLHDDSSTSSQHKKEAHGTINSSVVKAERVSSDSHSGVSGHNGTAGRSHRSRSMTDGNDEYLPSKSQHGSPEVIILSDSDNDHFKSTSSESESEPLFDLPPDERCKEDRSKSTPSPSLLEPNIDIQEDETVFYKSDSNCSQSGENLQQEGGNLNHFTQPSRNNEQDRRTLHSTTLSKDSASNQSERLEHTLKEHKHPRSSSEKEKFCSHNSDIYNDQQNQNSPRDSNEGRSRSHTPDIYIDQQNQNSPRGSTGGDSWKSLTHDIYNDQQNQNSPRTSTGERSKYNTANISNNDQQNQNSRTCSPRDEIFRSPTRDMLANDQNNPKSIRNSTGDVSSTSPTPDNLKKEPWSTRPEDGGGPIGSEDDEVDERETEILSEQNSADNLVLEDEERPGMNKEFENVGKTDLANGEPNNNELDVLPCDWTEVNGAADDDRPAVNEGRDHAPSDNSVNEDLADVRSGGEEEDEMSDSGDAVIANLTEEALNTLALPVTEKIMKWKKTFEDAQSKRNSEANHAGSRERSNGRQANPSVNQSKETIIQPVNIHFHFHEASPVSKSSRKGGGQKSILAYFKRTSDEGNTSSSGEETRNTKRENIAEWNSIMKRMRTRRNLVPLPIISQSSTSSVCDVPAHSSTTRAGPSRTRTVTNDNTKQRGKPALNKQCPFYKFIPGTSFVVDAFNYGSVEGVTAYFLTHFHYDHFQGLKKTFNHPIYCSKITARLVNQKLMVPLKYLYALPMCEPQVVNNVEVTLLDANHCPGAVMFLFKLRSGVTHLHVGDFRAHPSMESYPALQCQIHTLFLDTTYCSPEYVFPTQEKMVKRCVKLAKDHTDHNNKTLFVVGSYTIGKEKTFQAIASSLNMSIWVKADKRRILNCIDDREIQKRLSDSKTTSKVHVLPMREIGAKKLKGYLNALRPAFTEVVGIRPTGWEFTHGQDDDGVSYQHPFDDVHIYGIPYSEHSSYSELERFVKYIKPVKIVPTVNNGSKDSRTRMEKLFTKWRQTR